MGGSNLALSIVVNARDQASSIFSKIGNALGGMPPMLAGVGLAAGAAVVGLVGIGVKSVSMAADFQQSMLKVQALAGLTHDQMKQMGQSILQMAPQLGQAPKDLAEGLYFVVSAGFKGSDALNVLKYAGEAAATGNFNAKISADALTSALNAFGLKGKDAGNEMDLLTATVTNGKMEWGTYASVVGKLASITAKTGQSFVQTNAALDVYTNSGTSARLASNNLNNTLIMLEQKTDAIATHAKKLGVTFDENKFKSMDFAHQLQYLQTQTDGNSSTMLKLLGNNSVAAGTVQFLNQHYKNFTTTMGNLSGAMKNGQTTQQAFQVTQQGFNFQMAQAKSALDVVFITIGNALLPVLSSLMQKVTPLITQFAAWITKSGILKDITNTLQGAVNNLPGIINNVVSAVQSVVSWYNQWKPIINDTAIAITMFFVPAMIKAGVDAAISGAKIAINFVGNIIKSGVEGIQAAGKLAVFIGQTIATGAQAVIAGAKTAASFVANIVKSGAESVIAGAKIAASFIGNIVKSGAEAVIAGAKVTAQFIGSIVKSGAEAVIAGAKFVASLIPAIISFAAESITAAATAIPPMLAGFASWTIGAASAAAATIAATWPILLIVAGILILIGIIILLVTHWSQVTAFLRTAWQAFSSWFMAALRSIGQFFSNIWSEALKFISNIWSNIVIFVKSHALLLLAVITGPIGAIVILIVTHWSQIMSFLKDAWTWVVNTAKSLWTDVTTVFSNAWSGIQTALGTLWSNAKNLMAAWPQDMLNLGGKIISMLAQGITGAVGKVTGAVSGIWGKISGFFPHSPPKEGPGTDLPNWGPRLVTMFAQGIEQGIPHLHSSLNLLMAPVAQQLSSPGALSAPAPAPAAGGAVGGGGIIFNLTVNARPQDQAEMEQVARFTVQYFGDAIRAQFGNV